MAPENLHDSAEALRKLNTTATLVRFDAIGGVAPGVIAVFLYAGDWLSRDQLTQERTITAFEEVNSVHPGFDRYHAKGVCSKGWFDSNGHAAPLSQAVPFAPDRVPVAGRIAFDVGIWRRSIGKRLSSQLEISSLSWWGLGRSTRHLDAAPTTAR
jgi:hypothetical protein